MYLPYIWIDLLYHVKAGVLQGVPGDTGEKSLQSVPYDPDSVPYFFFIISTGSLGGVVNQSISIIKSDVIIIHRPLKAIHSYLFVKDRQNMAQQLFLIKVIIPVNTQFY